MGKVNAEPTLAMAASGYSNAYNVEGTRRCSVEVEVGATTNLVGTFYLVTRVSPRSSWQRHATLNAPRAATTALTARFDMPDRCGAEVGIEWVKASGTGPLNAQLFIQAD